MKLLISEIILISLTFINESETKKAKPKPNVVIIMSDDMGWSDVSMHGSEIPTPNIDSIGLNGIRFHRFYTPNVCTPSRASQMTGKYPIRVGLQTFPLNNDDPFGLGLDQKIFPEFFKEAGYATHLVGKWHLGHFQRAYAPNARGFDTFNGYLGGNVDYWTHTFDGILDRVYTPGLDLRRNYETNWDVNGTYVTSLFTDFAVDVIKHHDVGKPLYLQLNHQAPHATTGSDPLQAPQDEIDRFSYIKNKERRTLAAMIKVMDDGIGQVVAALDEKGILDNTIIVFYCDNGAPSTGIFATSGSNYPLRGQKFSPWEGASRIPAVMWAPNLPKNRVQKNLFHVSDLLPTLATACCVNLGPYRQTMDGIDQWATLRSRYPGDRTSLLYNIDPLFNYSAYSENGWKLVDGKIVFPGIDSDGWLGDFIDPDNLISDENYVQLIKHSPTNTALMKYGPKLSDGTISNWRRGSEIKCNGQPMNNCEPLQSPCLFNLRIDPCEYNNVADQHPDIVRHLLKRIKFYKSVAHEPRTKPFDPNSDPKFWNNTWTYWLDPVPL